MKDKEKKTRYHQLIVENPQLLIDLKFLSRQQRRSRNNYIEIVLQKHVDEKNAENIASTAVAPITD